MSPELWKLFETLRHRKNEIFEKSITQELRRGSSDAALVRTASCRCSQYDPSGPEGAALSERGTDVLRHATQRPSQVGLVDLSSEPDLSYRRVPPKSIRYVTTNFLLVGRQPPRPHRSDDDED